MRQDKTTRYHFDKNFLEQPLDFGDFHIVQAGRRYLYENSQIGDHTHLNWFELTLSTKGALKVSSDGRFSTVNPGEVYLSFPGDIHDIRTDNEQADYDYFAFFCKKDELENLYKDIWQYKRDYASRVFKDEKIQFLISSLIAELSSQNQLSMQMISSISRQIIIYTARDFLKTAASDVNVSDNKVLCQQIMNYIDTHIYSMDGLEELSKIFSYNYSYLSDLFKKTTDGTLSDYYRNRKFATAKVLMDKNHKTLSEIAELLGYSSPFSFSRAFKKKYGVSPKGNHRKI